MIYKLISIFWACLLTGGITLAQTFSGISVENDGQWQKASNAHRLSQFPKVHPSGKVWFQLRAPDTADTVKLSIGRTQYNMQKDEKGLWNIVLPKVNPGYQIYSFVVDGASFMDPGSIPFYSNGFVSVLEVPSLTDDYYLIRDVPHGDVREHWFYSTVEKKFRRSFVYKPGDVPGRMALAPDWAGNFGEMLIKEVIPDIDKYYRTIADPQHRAMAGLSLGGMLTNRVGMENTDMFAYYGLFSGGIVGDPETAHNGVMADAAEFNEKVKLIFQSCGSQESPERLVSNVEQLKDHGINAVSYVSPNTAHEWMTWRRSLYQFAPLIFK